MTPLKRKISLLSAILVAFSMVLLSGALYFLVVNVEQRGSNIPFNSIIYNDNYTLALSPEEQAWLKAHPIVRLGIDRAFPPFGSITKDNKYIGFTADYMRMIEYRLGIKFDIAKDMPWKQTLELAKQGKLDLIAGLVNTKQRQRFLDFTEPYVTNPTIIISNVMKNGYIGSVDNLSGKKVAIESGSFVETELIRHYPEVALIPVKNTSMALGLVASGAADAYIGNAVTANKLITQLGYHNLSFAGNTEYSSAHSVGIVKHDARHNVMLSGIVTKALASISKTDRDAIANHWFGMNTEPFIDKKTAYALAIALILLLMYLGSWSYCLRKSRNKLRNTQAAIQSQSEVDSLTSLGNRRKFYSLLDQCISHTSKTNIPFALFFLDLDRFKEINDSLGHAVGDLLLAEAARRISTCVSEHGHVSRIGGDEFMVLLPALSNREVLGQYAECIRSRINDLFVIEGHEINITTSIGISCFPHDANTAEQLVINGDQAMYYSKKRGRDCFSYFHSSMQKEAQYKTNLIKDLRVAVEQMDFSLYYQPIVDLSTGVVNKAEALIRWHHAERGFVSPAEFIPLAEEAGLINHIGEWVFEEAIDYTKTIQEQTNKHFQMSINTSPLQYDRNGINMAKWCKSLKSRGLSGKNIIVEITEGVLMETNETARGKLFNIRDLNIDIAIDDFGTGYSSLSYLKKFDIDYLKIDRTFVKNLSKDSDDHALVEAIIIMAHKLGIKVVAEGIETREQRDLLVGAGCDFGQGYYFSKPVAGDEFITLLKDLNKTIPSEKDQEELPLGLV